MISASTQNAALTGVRVLDLSRVLAGPWATQILGDFGAEVIKIEKPGEGDDTRSWGPPFLPTTDGSRGDAAYYLSANRNKRSVTINFSKPDGADLVRKLFPHCHVLVENFRAHGLRKYGLDYETIAAINPAIVYCSITGFGQTGPYAQRPGYDYIIQGIGGLMSVTGEPDGEPMKSAVAVADLFTGMYSVTSILAALRHAERTGKGQQIDVSLLDCQVAMLANLGASYLVSGKTPERVGNQHAAIAPYQVLATADGLIILAIGNDGQFRDFCRAANAALADDARFATNAARVNNRAALTNALAQLMLARTTTEWVSSLEAADVPCGPINTLDQVYADPQVISRNAVESATRADGAPVRLAASPVRLSETPVNTRLPPPLLGQDTDQVLRELLGSTAKHLSAWRDGGVI